MNAILEYVKTHTHDLLTGAAGTVSVLCGASVIPAVHMKFWLAAFAVLTYWSKFAKQTPESK